MQDSFLGAGRLVLPWKMHMVRISLCREGWSEKNVIPTTIIQGFENRHKIIASRSERHTVFWITRNLDEEWRFGEGHIVGLLRCDAVTSGYDVHEFRHPVQVVPADDFDPYMLEMLDRVAHAADTDGFVKAARVVGAAVTGHRRRLVRIPAAGVHLCGHPGSPGNPGRAAPLQRQAKKAPHLLRSTMLMPIPITTRQKTGASDRSGLVQRLHDSPGGKTCFSASRYFIPWTVSGSR